MADSELMAELRQTAREGGIDLIGATSAEPLPLDEGDWWGHDQPRDLLPAARAVVVAGFCARYEPRLAASGPGRPRGRFTNFGSRVFEQMEHHSWETVGGFLESRGYAAVRAPRLAIKPAIVRSGLGKYGKHAVVITPQLGSMVMFAALVTDAPLVDPAADAPVFAQLCPDNCTLCIQACPTGALAGDHRLDRSRCITSWLWGNFTPAELRQHQSDRLFGCAECLLACPANAAIAPRTSYPVAVDSVNDCPELLPLVAGDARRCAPAPRSRWATARTPRSNWGRWARLWRRTTPDCEPMPRGRWASSGPTGPGPYCGRRAFRRWTRR
jgi:epoxyqueuosine reductase QueG